MILRLLLSLALLGVTSPGQIILGGHVVTPHAASGTCAPYMDSFSGTSGTQLNPTYWTPTTATQYQAYSISGSDGYLSTLLYSGSGYPVPTTTTAPGGFGMSILTGCTSNSYAQAPITFGGCTYSSIGMNVSANGTGVWFGHLCGYSYMFHVTTTAGVAQAGTDVACASFSSGDMVQLSVSGTTYTATDVTTSTTLCSGTFTGYSGHAAILTESIATDEIKGFQAG